MTFQNISLESTAEKLRLKKQDPTVTSVEEMFFFSL